MAYSIPSQNAAYGYAAKFNPLFNAATLAQGYQGVKSTAGTEMMAKTLELDFLAKQAMAREGLNTLAAKLRQDSVNDASKELTELTIAANQKTAKRQLLANLLAGGTKYGMAEMAKPLDSLINTSGKIDQLTEADRRNGILQGMDPLGNLNAQLKAIGEIDKTQVALPSPTSATGLTTKSQSAPVSTLEMSQNTIDKAFPNAIPGLFKPSKKKETTK